MKKSVKKITASLLSLSLIMSGFYPAGEKNGTVRTDIVSAEEETGKIETEEYILFYSIRNGEAVISDSSCLIKSEQPWLSPIVEHITIPETIEGYKVTEIADNALYGMRYYDISLPDTIRKLGDHSLGNYNYFGDYKYFRLPADLEEIGTKILGETSDYFGIYIPDKVSVIKDNPFGTIRFKLSEKNENFRIDDGVLMTADNTEVICYLRDDRSGNKITLPDGVKKICSDAFSNSHIKEIVLPDSLEEIGSSAFENSFIQRIDIPGSVKEIKDNTFSNCLFLKELVIRDGVLSIGKNAFYRTNELSSIKFGNTLREIGDNAFYLGINIDTVHLPASLEKIGNDVFLGISAKKFEVDPDNKYFSSPDGVLVSNKESRVILCPENNDITSFTVPDGIRKIDSSAFSSNKNLTSVIFPDSLEEMGTHVFYECSELNTISIPEKVKRIEEADFFGCTSLEKVDLPADLEYIGSRAFMESGIKEIDIPDKVEYIGERAFKWCEDLKKVSISPLLTKIEADAFPESAVITLRESSGTVTVGKTVFSEDMTELIKYSSDNAESYTVPDSVKKIGDGAFFGSGLTEIILPEGLEYIGNNAFEKCEDLTGIVIPEGVKEIGNEAFSYCFNLLEAEFKGAETKLGTGVFEECRSMYKICLPSGIRSVPEKTFSECTSLFSARIPDGTEELCSGSMPCLINEVYIPSSVTKIAEDAFSVYNNKPDHLQVICGKPGSYAQEFAEKYNIIFFSDGEKNYSSDINGDGKTDIVDLIRLKAFLLGDHSAEVSDADVNGDGSVNAADLAAMIRVILGAEEKGAYSDMRMEAVVLSKPDNYTGNDYFYNCEFDDTFIEDQEMLEKYIGTFYSKDSRSAEIIREKFSDCLSDHVLYMKLANHRNSFTSGAPNFYAMSDSRFTFELINFNMVRSDKPVLYTVMIPRSLYKDQKVNLVIDTKALADKPVIYLYPEEETKINVKVSLDETSAFTCTYPKYPEDTGWNVTAEPDSTLYDENGRQYSYLFWEAETYRKWDMSTGFVVKGEDTVEFLQDKLEYLGLTPKEYNDFIVYWLPKMQDNKYNLITFQTDDYEKMAKLEVTPEPDSVQRVFMTFKALDEYTEVPEQTLVPFERHGFSVIEWGGAEVR